MPSIEVPAFAAAVTNATDRGVCTVASTAAIYAGAIGWLQGSDGSRQRCQVVEVLSGTTFSVRYLHEENNGYMLNPPNYGRSNASDFDAHALIPAAKAELDLADLGTGALDTIVEATTAGEDGNEITVELVGDNGAAAGVTIDVTGSVVTIHYEHNVSTVSDVETAITALAGGDDIIGVKTAGTGATVLQAPIDDFGATNLAGGSDEIAELTVCINLPTQLVAVNPDYTRKTSIIG